MELCDNNALRALLAEVSRTKGRKPGSRATKPGLARLPAAMKAPARQAGRRQCHCGTCPKCVENARWERIFQERFADPLYYSPRGIRHNSPINSL
jgi:hypothetical protein